MKALSFGEILWDIIGGEEHLGGAPFNLAAHLSQCDAESFMISCLGKDERGERVLREMKRLNVDSSFVRVDPGHATGTVDVTLSEDGQPSYCINEGVAWDLPLRSELWTFTEAGYGWKTILRGEAYSISVYLKK